MVFTQEFEITCCACSRQINEGDPAHRVDSVVLHEGCRRPDPRFAVTTRKVVAA